MENQTKEPTPVLNTDDSNKKSPHLKRKKRKSSRLKGW